MGRYASMNLGLHVGDDSERVNANRALFEARLGVRPIFMEQVHGTELLNLDALLSGALKADGAFTTQAALACTVMVADCLPVLLCDGQGRQIAAVHAGWRGLLGSGGKGVLEGAAAAFDPIVRCAGQADRSSLLAWLGPCIGPKAFEVGEEVRAAFVAATPMAAACFSKGSSGKWWADLPALARQRLSALGIEKTFGNDGSDKWCTSTNASRFFSHRRDGISGRMAACIWLID